MNIRRGEVHEVVSFYSFLQVPLDVARVCTGPVCDCMGARANGALRGRLRRPLRSRAGADAGRRDRRRRHAPDELVADRAGRAAGAARPPAGRGAGPAGGGRPHRDGGRRLPDLPQVGGRPRRARAARRDRQRRRGRAGDDQGPLRDGAAPAAAARGSRGGDALLRDRPRVHLPARGVRDLPRAPPRGDRRPRAERRARRRRRLVRLRRGVGDARVDGGPARDAAAAAALPRAEGLPRAADADQQRRDARARGAHPARRVHAGAALVRVRAR